MLVMRTPLPDLNHLDQDGLKALIVAQHEQLQIKDEQLLWREQEIAHLKLLLAKLRRMQFGRKSERVARQIEQLELQLEELEASRAPDARQAEPPSSPENTDSPATRTSRRTLPAHLPSQTRTHEPKQTSCPECGGRLKKLGEDCSEMLEWVPGSFQVLRHVRPKLCCTGCDVIVQAAAPSRPIDAGWRVRACWPMYWFPSSVIICRCIASRRSMGAKGSSWTARRWPSGWEKAASCWNPWWKFCAVMSWRPTSCMAMTHRCRCWLQATGRPRRGGSGPMFATIVRAAIRYHQRCGLPTLRIAKGNIRSSI